MVDSKENYKFGHGVKGLNQCRFQLSVGRNPGLHWFCFALPSDWP